MGYGIGGGSSYFEIRGYCHIAISELDGGNSLIESSEIDEFICQILKIK
jgi:hypothetical protein